MTAPPPAADRALLAQRIQGFGNVNPPPLEEETGSTVAKRAVGRLGDMLGEEVALTVEDFREKGAVGAVKDAVADAGDILIDGVSGIIGWIRGDPPPEEESVATEEATKALSNGPGGAAYGVSQASPTGGINAVWVMPEEADPATLAQLSTQAGGLANDPRVPKNIQPYQPPPGRAGAMNPPPFMPQGAPLSIPGGPTIAPYQPAPSGPTSRAPPFVPGFSPNAPGGFQQPGRWGPAGYNPASGMPAPAPRDANTQSGAKGLIERIAKGEVLVGQDVAKRLVSQCQATKTTGKQLGEMICERSRRLYLGLDGGDPADADSALLRLLSLVDALSQMPASEVAKAAAGDATKGVSEEFLSLQSSTTHRAAAEQFLKRLGLVAGAGSGASSSASAGVDLLGGDGNDRSAPAVASAPTASTDLLGAGDAVAAPASSGLSDDIFGGGEGSAAAFAPASAPPGVGSLDPLSAAPPAAAGSAAGSNVLAGLSMDFAPASTASPGSTSTGAAPVAGAAAGTLGAGAKLASSEKKEDEPFSFVGAELSKASSGK